MGVCFPVAEPKGSREWPFAASRASQPGIPRDPGPGAAAGLMCCVKHRIAHYEEVISACVAENCPSTGNGGEGKAQPLQVSDALGLAKAKDEPG